MSERHLETVNLPIKTLSTIEAGRHHTLDMDIYYEDVL